MDYPRINPKDSKLLPTAVCTATIIKIVVVIVVVLLVHFPGVWRNPVRWVLGGGLVMVFLFALCLWGIRRLRFGLRGGPADLVYPVCSLLAVMVIMLFAGPHMHVLNSLFFFPVIIAGLTLGRRGMAVVPAAVAFMLGMDLYHNEFLRDWCVVDNIVAGVTLIFTAWLVGEATEANRRAHRERLDTAHRLRTVLDALPTGVLAMDRLGEVLSLNRYLRTLIGPDPQREKDIAAAIRDMLPDTETGLGTGHLRDADDRTVPVQVSRHPVTIKAQTAEVVVVQNLTDRQKRREIDLMFRRLLAEWDLGVIFLDGDGRVRIHNEAARRCLGREEDFEGRYPAEFLPELAPETPMLELVRGDRTLQIMRSSWSETPDGGPWTLLIINDITDQRKAELEMQRARNLASLGQVAAGVAHELRNPLTTIRGFTQLALEADDPAKIRSHLAFVGEETERMQGILNRFLRMAQPAKPSYEPLDLCEIVHWVWDLIYNDSLSRQITLVRELPDEKLITQSDAQQLRQVVLNLVNNAFEATPAGGRVTISCRRDGQHAVLSVRDTGCGIPAHLRDEIFVPFVTTKETGTGLGLAISREIIQKHGGRLEADSTAGGAAFHIILPFVHPA